MNACPAEAPPPLDDKVALPVVSSYAAAFVAFRFLVDTPPRFSGA
jgi:hypothetical protein